jgi:DNA-binding transcriptional LysR family regulator
MAEFVERKLQLAAVALATELNYPQAARTLDISLSELERQITALETILSMKMFRTIGKNVVVTNEGRVFVEGCQAFLEARDIMDR